MIPTSIPDHIRAENISGHLSAIDAIHSEIHELISHHKINDGVIDKQINQLLTGYRCLILEVKEMKQRYE